MEVYLYIMIIMKKTNQAYRSLSIYSVKFSLAARLRGHKQRKLNDNVYLFFQAEF